MNTLATNIEREKTMLHEKFLDAEARFANCKAYPEMSFYQTFCYGDKDMAFELHREMKNMFNERLPGNRGTAFFHYLSPIAEQERREKYLPKH